MPKRASIRISEHAPDGLLLKAQSCEPTEQLLADLRRLTEPRWNDYPDEAETKACVRAAIGDTDA